MDHSLTLRVYLTHASPETCHVLHEVCRDLGHEVAGVFHTCADLQRACRNDPPDLIMTGVHLPDGDGIETLIELGHEIPIPAILVTKDADLDLVERAVADHVMAYLVEPVTPEEIKPAIHLVVLRFKQFNEMREEIDNLREALEARKLIEKAKGVLMKRHDLEEDEAFRRLQKTATSRRTKLVEIAKEILETQAGTLSSVPPIHE
jgi:AmiR/NasT family two-component response regulator